MENTPQITQFISQVMSGSGYSAREVMETMLAVEEACTNIIALHAYSREAGSILLEANITADAVEISIEDEGLSFDPTAERAAAQAGERAGGWGIMLMLALVDSVAYQRLQEKTSSA